MVVTGARAPLFRRTYRDVTSISDWLALIRKHPATTRCRGRGSCAQWLLLSLMPHLCACDSRYLSDAQFFWCICVWPFSWPTTYRMSYFVLHLYYKMQRVRYLVPVRASPRMKGSLVSWTICFPLSRPARKHSSLPLPRIVRETDHKKAMNRVPWAACSSSWAAALLSCIHPSALLVAGRRAA